MSARIPKVPTRNTVLSNTLNGIDDIFDFPKKEEPEKSIKSSESGGLTEMAFDQMEPFPEHKFRFYEGQQLADMVESIRQFGILLPIILWHTEDGQYIILSGHNRRNAARLAGLTRGPVIIRENLTHDEAVLIVTETNLRQRSFADMSHSERAYCLAQHYEALKSQGKRNDLLAEIETLLSSHGCEENETSAEVQHRLLYDTGARVQEIIDLIVTDIRFVSPAIVRLTGKGRKTRSVPLMSNTVKLLQSYIQESGSDFHDCNSPVFKNKQGQKLTRNGVAYIINKYATQAAFEGVSPQFNITPMCFGTQRQCIC